MRLIDADNLPVVTECCVDEAGFFAKFKVVHDEDIQKAPTIAPDSLRPHGEWEEIEGDYRCTNCHHAPTVGIDNEFRLTNFCPNCGADMRGNLNA